MKFFEYISEGDDAMKKEYLFFVIFPISQLLMIVGHYMIMKTTDVFASTGFIMSIVADLVLLYVLIHGVKKEKIEKELEELKYLKEIEEERNEYLKNGQQEVFEMRKVFQDKINEIERQIKEGKKTEILNEIENLQEELNKTKMGSCCPNMIVNAVVNGKMKECEKLGITLDANLMIPRHLEVEPLHMCSIFSNLLDNAIEAVKVLNEEKQKICVFAELKGNYLFIKVLNPSTKEHVMRKRRKGHGYGTKILEDIARKYEGEYDASFKKGLYTATIAVRAV